MTNDVVINVVVIVAVVSLVRDVLHHAQIHLLVTGSSWFKRRQREPQDAPRIYRAGQD